MTDTTNILDLPMDPTGGGSNITISAQENNIISPNHNTSSTQPSSSFSLDQTTINQIVNGLQQASSTGVTQLPSRDIPQNTSSIIQDSQIQATYIPQSENKSDYIKDYETNEDIINNYNKSYKNNNSLDEMYNEIQVPLLLAVLYFLFQLPIFKKTLYHYLPIIFSKDGNYNINGFIFTSCLFGFLFYILNKIIFHFSVF
jgi:hypothetical protein